MTPLRLARIVKCADVPARGASSAALPLVGEGTRRRVAREAVEASVGARRILEDARTEARVILDQARVDAARAAEDAREEEKAKLAAAYLALRAADERRAERDLDRVVDMARVLAERLLGEALDERPERVASLARQVLLEARGASRAVIEAAPLDVEPLRSHLVEVGLPSSALEVRVDPALSRGSLRIHTNLGSLDAQLTPQLERLAKALRDALRHG